MPKAGDAYQDLAAELARVLLPGATVEVGVWVEGPDGSREVDVSARGVIDGADQFVLVECKDWKKPVDVQAIDALDSKRRDLGADRAAILSACGFSDKALRKAARVGIDAATIMVSGDPRIRETGVVKVARLPRFRAVAEKWYFAREAAVARYRTHIVHAGDPPPDLPDKASIGDLLFDGLPVVNWLAGASQRALSDHRGAARITMTFVFVRDLEFSLAGVPLALSGLWVEMECSLRWLKQKVEEEVSFGLYRFLGPGTGQVVVPPGESYAFGPISSLRADWIASDEGPAAPDPARTIDPGAFGVSGSFALNLTFFDPIRGIEGAGTPPLDELVAEEHIERE